MGYLNTVFKNKKPETFTYKEITKILKEAIEVSCKDNLGIDDNTNVLYTLKNSYDLVTDTKIEIIDQCEWKTVKVDKDKFKTCETVECKDCKYNIRYIWDKEKETVIGMYKR